MYSLYLHNFLVNSTRRETFFFLKVSMIDMILISCNSLINKKVILWNLRFRSHISCFCSISPTKNHSKHSHNTVLRLWATWEWFVPEWIDQLFKWFGSIATTHLLSQRRLLAILSSHLKYLHFLYNFKHQFSTFYVSNIKTLFMLL